MVILSENNEMLDQNYETDFPGHCSCYPIINQTVDLSEGEKPTLLKTHNFEEISQI